MSLASDLFGAALSVEIAAQRSDNAPELTARLVRLAETLQECAERAREMERMVIEPHWRRQRAPLPDELAGNVVSLRRPG